MAEFVQMRGMLLPPAPGLCRICAVDHKPDEAHDATSLYYQTRLHMRYGRQGTWADAIAHLPESLRALWRMAVGEYTEFTYPPAGVAPVAEPIDG